MRAFTFLLVVLTLLSCSTKDEAETDSPASSAYFAVGQDGAIVTSQDGSTWRLLQSGTTNSFREIVYGGGGLLTVGDNATAVYSEDFGNTWKASNALGGFSSESFDGAYFVNDKYFITTWGGKGSLLTSSDAISWVEQDNFSSTTGYYKIVFGNNNYLAVGDNGSVQLSPDMGDCRLTWATVA